LMAERGRRFATGPRYDAGATIERDETDECVSGDVGGCEGGQRRARGLTTRSLRCDLVVDCCWARPLTLADGLGSAMPREMGGGEASP